MSTAALPRCGSPRGGNLNQAVDLANVDPHSGWASPAICADAGVAGRADCRRREREASPRREGHSRWRAPTSRSSRRSFPDNPAFRRGRNEARVFEIVAQNGALGAPAARAFTRSARRRS